MIGMSRVFNSGHSSYSISKYGLAIEYSLRCASFYVRRIINKAVKEAAEEVRLLAAVTTHSTAAECTDNVNAQVGMDTSGGGGSTVTVTDIGTDKSSETFGTVITSVSVDGT